MLQSWSALTDYLRAVFGHEKTEQLHVLFLDARTRLIADEIMGRRHDQPCAGLSTGDRSPRFGASCVDCDPGKDIIIPSGVTDASRDDVAMTREVRRALQPLGVTLHDHFIVTGDACVSMSRQGLLA